MAVIKKDMHLYVKMDAHSLQQVTNIVNIVRSSMTLATKRIPVTEETLNLIKSLGHKGQTYDDLLQDMAEAYRRERFLKMLKERREEGDFVDIDEAFE